MADANNSNIGGGKEDSGGASGSNKLGDEKFAAENKAASTCDAGCSITTVREEDKLARAQLLAAAEKWEKIQRTFKPFYPF